jgi:hypothetical protein
MRRKSSGTLNAGAAVCCWVLVAGAEDDGGAAAAAAAAVVAAAANGGAVDDALRAPVCYSHGPHGMPVPTYSRGCPPHMTAGGAA